MEEATVHIKTLNKELKKQGEKKCCTCLSVKKLSDFYYRPGSARHAICKSCTLKYYHEKWKTKTSEEKALRRAKYRSWYDKLRSEIIKEYGGSCVCCGEEQVEFLSVDHINGGGTKHRKTLGGGTAFFKWLRDNNYPKNEYRLLCMNCNWARGRYGYCPHEKEKNA